MWVDSFLIVTSLYTFYTLVQAFLFDYVTEKIKTF